MIRNLRRRHRLLWAVLFPVLAVLLAAAVLLRPEPPLVDVLPEPRRSAPDTNEARGQDESPRLRSEAP